MSGRGEAIGVTEAAGGASSGLPATVPTLRATRIGRRAELVAAAVLIIVGLIFSPPGLFLLNAGRAPTARAIALTVALDAFLIAVVGGILSQGRRRQLFLHLMAWVFPFAALAGLEELARVKNLADRVAPFFALNLLERQSWPDHLMRVERFARTADGQVVYAPWSADGIFINELGLRTALPGARTPGEWRIGVTGGSAVWGWRVSDADTIPVILQRLLAESHRKNVRVFNFGIEGAMLGAELETVRRFQALYGLDEILFYTGSNDARGAYTGLAGELNWARGANTIELVNALRRVLTLWRGEDPAAVAALERDKLPAVLRNSSIRQGILAADEYCRSMNISCRFALQPTLLTANIPAARETAMVKMWRAAMPGFGTLTRSMYRDALGARPDRTYDLSHALDQEPEAFFLDDVHLNEKGNRLVARALVSSLFGAEP